MDLNIVSSEHSKQVFLISKYDKIDQKTNQKIGVTELTKPIELLLEGANLDVYKPLKKEEFTELNLLKDINSIPEDFVFLSVDGDDDFGASSNTIAWVSSGFTITMGLFVSKSESNTIGGSFIVFKTILSGSVTGAVLILAASIRTPIHIIQVAKLGVDVITLPPKLIEVMINNPLTDKGIEIFLNDWNNIKK